jgi:hypothetical protein
MLKGALYVCFCLSWWLAPSSRTPPLLRHNEAVENIPFPVLNSLGRLSRKAFVTSIYTGMHASVGDETRFGLVIWQLAVGECHLLNFRHPLSTDASVGYYTSPPPRVLLLLLLLLIIIIIIILARSPPCQLASSLTCIADPGGILAAPEGRYVAHCSGRAAAPGKRTAAATSSASETSRFYNGTDTASFTSAPCFGLPFAF